VRRSLLAGHDVLTIAQFAPRAAWSMQLDNVRDAIDYLAAEYERDPAIRAQVDAAARRILAAKARLIPTWDAAALAIDSAAASRAVGQRSAADAAASIARQAVTAWALHSRPQRGDRIAVVTPGSAGAALDCAGETCGLAPARWRRLQTLGPTLVEGLLLEGYGPDGTGAIRVEDVLSLTFCQLGTALRADDPPTPTAAPEAESGTGTGTGTGTDAVATAPVASSGGADPCDPPGGADAVRARLAEADWIVLAIGELSGDAVRLLGGFLLPQASRVAGASGGHLAVLSFGPPYYVDATNHARLDVHLSAYSKVPASIEAAIDALFGELAPAAAAPVTVEDADYVLSDRLEADPARPLPTPAIRRMTPPDVLPARVSVAVGPVLDRNGHPVPDDAPIELAIEPPGAAGDGIVRLPVAGGYARGELVVRAGGRLDVSARSSSGARSAPASIELPRPTEAPSPAPTTAAASATGTGGGAGAEAASPARAPGPAALAWSLAATALASALAATRSPRPTRQTATGRAACGGLALYCAYAWLRRTSAVPVLLPFASEAALVALAGAGIALAAAPLRARARATRQRGAAR